MGSHPENLRTPHGCGPESVAAPTVITASYSRCWNMMSLPTMWRAIHQETAVPPASIRIATPKFAAPSRRVERRATRRNTARILCDASVCASEVTQLAVVSWAPFPLPSAVRTTSCLLSESLFASRPESPLLSIPREGGLVTSLLL